MNKKGSWAASEQAVDKAVSLAPEDDSLWVLKGWILSEHKKYALAAAAYRQGLKLAPHNIEGWNNLAGTLREMGDVQGAEEAARRAGYR